MTDLGLCKPMTIFFGMEFLGMEEAAHTPKADVANLNDPVPFQGDIQVIAETAAAGADDGFVPDFHAFAPKLIYGFSSYHQSSGKTTLCLIISQPGSH
jgi:hypothetical protein